MQKKRTKKQVSLIRKYHNLTPQTNLRHCKEEPQNTDCHKTPERQLKQSNQLSLAHQDDCKTRQSQGIEKQNKDPTQNPNKQWEQQSINNNRTNALDLTAA